MTTSSALATTTLAVALMITALSSTPATGRAAEGAGAAGGPVSGPAGAKAVPPPCADLSPWARHPECRNWQPPAGKILAQRLIDQVMATHPELISMTAHGVPPGTDVHTMFAGSFPDRIGDGDDPGDYFSERTSSTILDPSYDQPGKFVVFIPMLDVSGKQVGSLVIGFRDDAAHQRTAMQFYQAALEIRDGLQKEIPSLQALFKPQG